MKQQIAQQRGFTLIELLIAITLVAVLAGMSWRGLDTLARTRESTQTRIQQMAVVQTVLAQWQADLNAMQAVPKVNDAGVLWDGRVLRITRRASTFTAQGTDLGLWVVGWTQRNGQWLRWQSPAITTHTQLQQAWQQAERWGQNPSTDDLVFQTPLLPLDQWQLSYFRGNAWSNPLSSASTADSASGTAASATSTTNTTPDAIRLLIDLPAPTGLSGRLTLDWVRPNFSNTKS
jgi:general secretion pathway protein J